MAVVAAAVATAAAVVEVVVAAVAVAAIVEVAAVAADVTGAVAAVAGIATKSQHPEKGNFSKPARRVFRAWLFYFTRPQTVIHSSPVRFG